MKNFTIVMSSLFVLNAGYVIAEAPEKVASEPGFELINKADAPIWFSLTNGSTIDVQLKRLDSGAGFGAKIGRIGAGISDQLTEGSEIIDIKKPTRLFIWMADPGKVNFSEKWWSFGDSVPRVKPDPDYVYTFIPGKTMYVTWDKKKFLRPQTGPLGGYLRKTDSGFPLANNVNDSKDEIILKFSKKSK